MAAHRAMSRLGPGELTLAHIAAEAGLTAGALVQRFGSKRDLMLQLSERFSGGTGEMFAGLRRAHRSPLAALRAYADCMAGMAETPAALVRSLSYLQIDLTDPEFHSTSPSRRAPLARNYRSWFARRSRRRNWSRRRTRNRWRAPSRRSSAVRC